MKKLIYILVLGLAFTACKKEPLPDLPDETGPYYSIKGYIDGDFIDLNVGQEGILISQGKSTNNGIESYYGQIVSPSEDLLIKVEFTRPETPLTAQGLKAIQEGHIDFLVHQPGCLSPTFGSNQQQSNYMLIKNEQGIFQPITEVEFDEFGIHNMTIDFTNDSQNSFIVPIQYGYEPIALNPKFSASPASDSVHFEAYNSEGVHEWYIDGSLVSSDPDFTTQMDIGIHQIEHKITDANSNVASHFTLVRITDFVLDWMMDLQVCGSTFASSNYGKVTVTVLTGNKEYKSDNSMENLLNSFVVNDVEYVGNSSLVPTRAVFDLSFNATLVDETGSDSLSLTGMSGTFNVGLQ